MRSFINKKGFVVILILALGFGTYKVFNEESQVEPQELSAEEYEKARQGLLELMNEHDPKFALAELRERIKSDNPLLRSCHPLVHELGHAAYEKYRDFGKAMEYQDEICNSGYLHGIIENHFLKSPDVFGAMGTVCDPYPLGKYMSWECYHGVGHGVMYYTSNDLPRSLELCEKYENTFASSSCINGVFMENFNVDQKVHVSKFVKESEPFFPCEEQAPLYKGDCYLYAPTYYLSLHQNDYTGALKLCEGAEAAYKSACVQGVGSQAMKENINSPKLVERVCLAAGSAQENSCITGMVNLYINHYGSAGPAQELCKQLELGNRETCYSSVRASLDMFN